MTLDHDLSQKAVSILICCRLQLLVEIPFRVTGGSVLDYSLDKYTIFDSKSIPDIHWQVCTNL
jgi:hypothetical protein